MSLDIKVLIPPGENEIPRYEPVVCAPDEMKPGNKGCGFTTTLALSREKFSLDIPVGICPECKRKLYGNLSAYRPGIGARGVGFHATKFGQRRKNDMIRRNTRLAKTQWDNHAPMPVAEGAKILNPTPGGPLDPNGAFAKKKKRTS